MSEQELVAKYGITERGNTLIAKANLTSKEIADLKGSGWRDDSDPDYLIKVGGAK